MQQVLTIDEIKAQYPDQWVLVGNPVIRQTHNRVAFCDLLSAFEK